MKRNNYGLLLAICIFLGITFLLFFPFFTKSLHPFPGDFHIAWFEPWKTNFNQGTFIEIPHKPIAHDVFRQLYPFRVLGTSIMQRFEFPFWNPYNGSGMPLFATMHIGFLNPFNALFFLLPQQLAWSVLVVLQTFLIGILMYVFTKKTGLSYVASLFSSVSFTLSSFVVVRSIYADYNYAIVGFLLLLYSIESYIKKRSKKIFFIPFAVFLIICSSQPQIVFYLLFFAIIYGIVRVEKFQSRKLLYIFSLILIGVGLTSVQLLPTIELIQHSNINTESSRFIIESFLLPIQHFISLLIPNYFGNQATYNYWGSADYIETVIALGIIPIFFALLSWKNSDFNKSIKKLYILVIIASFMLTLDSPVSRFLYSLPIPILSTNIPERIFVLTLFSFSMLSGLGIDAFIKRKVSLQEIFKTTTPLFVTLLVIVMGTILFFVQDVSCNNTSIPDCRKIALRNTGLEAFAFLVFLSSCIVALKTKRDKMYIYSVYLTIFLVVALGVYNGYKFLPFTQKERVLPEISILQTIKQLDGHNRVFGFEKANIKTDFATYFRFYDPNYYDPLYIKRYGELVEFSNKLNTNDLKRSDVEIVSDLSIEPEKEERRNRLLNLLSVKLLLQGSNKITETQKNNLLYRDSKWTIINNTNALPRAYFVSGIEQIFKNEDILNRLFNKSFNPQDTAIVEEPIPEEIRGSQNQQNATITHYSENKVFLATTTSKPSFLVLTDNYYPGWKAYIDNVETKIYRTNYTFRGVIVPEGKHIVVFDYFPQSFVYGLILSIASLIIYAAVLFLYSTRKDVL